MTDTEDAWKTLLQTNDWIKVADAKAAATLAASGVLGSVLARSAPGPTAWRQEPWLASLTMLSLTLTVISAFFALRVFAPRLRAGEPRSLMYFDHIARRYPKALDFKLTFICMLDRDGLMRESIIEQLWANSRVARRKFKQVAYAIWLLGGALATQVAAGLAQALLSP
ncbi:Pycsar system effector family protein [Amycolatopsis sp. WGS_07]|uniref:Pycsar system effector family protein n=1 Tax=Amycolatopsis sp. WGS_07 TaxID=3076764 RepID=UPI0038736F83